MPRAKLDLHTDYYEISMRQFAQQILPPALPTTTVWGYGAVKSANPKGLLLHNAPSLTIEARYNRPVQVKWINELVDANGNYLPHLLPVDPTLHWANPPGGEMERDMRPTFAETPGPTPDRCRWSPTCTARWALATRATATPKPGSCRRRAISRRAMPPKAPGTTTSPAKRLPSYGATWGPGFATFQYPNANRASTIWYHDHALGMTRLNVYAGPAGFYIVRGGPDGDAAVRDSRTGRLALLPRPAPKEWEQLFPSFMRKYREIPIAIQDRAFNADGSLFYPDTREFLRRSIAGPVISRTPIVSPIWNPEFFGNMIMVNGNTWPYLDVDKVRYRFRFLNGCQSRFLILDFSQIPGVEVWQIGNEGGFLAAPVNITATSATGC